MGVVRQAICFFVALVALVGGSGTVLAERLVLLPDAIYQGHGDELKTGWGMVVENGEIVAIGPKASLDIAGARTLELDGMTLLPGLIDAHSHVLLHPYDEISWTDQVLKESRAERAIRAANHAEAALMAGFTTYRDLGSEGAGYDDVGIRKAIEKGVIAGPRLLVAGRAIVATGSYGPKGFAPHVRVPLGAEEADAADLVRIVRDQIGHGVDWVKVYADYRWGPNGEARPTFSVEELKLIVETARSSGRPVVAHAATEEGMRRATVAGVETIEHGSAGTPKVFRLMAKNGVAWCPTLAAGEAISTYRGWRKGVDPAPARVLAQRSAFAAALKAGVRMCLGSDVGVFPHGQSAREAELMVEYGMTPGDVLTAATSGNADILHLGDRLGRLQVGYIADIIAVDGNPLTDISALANVRLVIKDGEIAKN